MFVLQKNNRTRCEKIDRMRVSICDLGMHVWLGKNSETNQSTRISIEYNYVCL